MIFSVIFLHLFPFGNSEPVNSQQDSTPTNEEAYESNASDENTDVFGVSGDIVIEIPEGQASGGF